MTEQEKPRECFACGTVLRGGYGTSYWRDEIAPGHSVYLCIGRYSDPKQSCYEKALKKLKLCPGCGEEMGQLALIAQLCRTCKENLDEGTKANLAERLSTYELAAWKLSWGERSRDGEVSNEFVDCLARAVCGRGSEVCDPGFGGGSYRKVEVTAGQKEALEKLAGLFKDMLGRAYKDGQRSGRGFITALARGEVRLSELSAVEEGEDA